jgi:N-dimethylarginine dimethylaminohydrolase
MIVTDSREFLAAWRELPATPWGASTPRGVMLMAPEGLSASAVTCADNRYMDASIALDGELAHAQHRALVMALARAVPAWCFPGDASTPDATFLNNAFATVPGRLILGAMRYPERQRETARGDITSFFSRLTGAETLDLGGKSFVAELTGSLIVDRRRGVGFCGLGERCTIEGARAMHDAFGLRLTYAFDLAPGEYHTNVVMSVLAGRTLVLCPEGLGDVSAAGAIGEVYDGDSVMLSVAEKNAFAGNCIAVTPSDVWMSAGAKAGLAPGSRSELEKRGWRVQTVDLSEIEKAGGSLRCCVAEVY